MPHSTKGSTGSYQTFDLTSQDRPMTPHSSSRPNSSYGVAVTSPTTNDERTSLPSQKDAMAAIRRKSSPGNPGDVYAYADLIKSSGNIDQVVKQGANDRRSYSYTEAAKRKSQYYEEQFQYKDNAVGGVRERAVRQSPIIAELKTNVIVSRTRASALSLG